MNEAQHYAVGLLTEEIGEVVVLTAIGSEGLDGPLPPGIEEDERPLDDLLVEEFGDILAGIDYACTCGLVDPGNVERLRDLSLLSGRARSADAFDLTADLIRAAGGALKMLGKAVRFGIDTPGRRAADGIVPHETPRSLLERHLAEIISRIVLLCESGRMDAQSIEARRLAKYGKLVDPLATDNLGRRLAPDPLS